MHVDAAAEYANLSVATLRYYRQMGTGPKSGKLGRRVIYRKSDLDTWIASAFN
ncbi:helix-turn-helix transcriptional regulator [Mycobacteroides abscessus]